MNEETDSTKNTNCINCINYTEHKEHKEHNKDLEHREEHNKGTEDSENTEQDKEPIFLQYLVYQPETGNFFFKQRSSRVNKEENLRLLTPNEDCYLTFVVQGKFMKVRAIKAAFMLYAKQLGKDIPEIKKDYVLYSKNLNKFDLRYCNIGLCSRETMFKINEAQRNLHGDLKLLLHPKDMFSYVVHWTEDRQKRKKVVHDVVLAKKLFLRLQLKFSKVLAKYLVLD